MVVAIHPETGLLPRVLRDTRVATAAVADLEALAAAQARRLRLYDIEVRQLLQLNAEFALQLDNALGDVQVLVARLQSYEPREELFG